MTGVKSLRRSMKRKRIKHRSDFRNQKQMQADVPLKKKLVFLRTVICSTIFITCVALKLLLPGSLSAFRATLREYLVSDADFVAAFSAVGRAFDGTKNFTHSMADAYVAVFAPREAEDARQAEMTLDRPLPDDASLETIALPFSSEFPLNGTVTSGFGWRVLPDTQRDSFHYGCDISAAEGEDILCFADGVVAAVAESTLLGKYLTVQHANGFETIYAHCSKITVGSGDNVLCGQKIAEVGKTGNATGTHLHFSIMQGMKYIDPMQYAP